MPQFEELSDEAWRVWCGALMWSTRYGTDGRIPRIGLKALHPLGEAPRAFDELLAAGLWVETGDGFQVLEWKRFAGQSLAETLQEQRDRKAKNAADKRARDKQAVTGDVIGDVTGYRLGKARPGEARQGKARQGIDIEAHEAVEAWDVVPIPGSSSPDYSAESEAF